jgi:3D (Asp-Asp-Asp) domain-containing protein
MTAYTQYHSPPQRTASGTMPATGRTVAVDPTVIPLGTKLHIEGVGVRIAEDTGRKIKGRKLDLFLSSIGDCTRFGVRSRQVYILD